VVGARPDRFQIDDRCFIDSLRSAAEDRCEGAPSAQRFCNGAGTVRDKRSSVKISVLAAFTAQRAAGAAPAAAKLGDSAAAI
jgi:hypothetical protein